jgi:hypothetical protein
MISVSACAVAGVSDAGFMTTVLPKASAGAAFHAGIAIGKFQGVISPKTPSGSRYVSTATPGRVDSTVTPWRRRASPAMNLKMRAARMTSPLPSGSVLPSSRDSRRPRSSARAMISEPTLSSRSERTSGEAFAHAGNAAFAAETAALTVFLSPPGTCATTSPVLEGFRLSEAGEPATH